MDDDTCNDDGSVNEHARLLSQVREKLKQGEKYHPLEYPADPEGDEKSRVGLEKLIAPGQKLHTLLDRSELRVLRARIDGLLVRPRDFSVSPLQPGEDADKIEQS